jgi:preprotein translocase subunit SecF
MILTRNKLTFFQSLLLAVICTLQGIFTFGSTKTLLKQSTSTFQIDTRNATIDDVLGHFELKSIKSESSTTTTSTSRPGSIPTSTSTVQTINPTYAALAEDYLGNITAILEEVISDPSTSPDFSLARVFQVNDFLTLANSGFLCHSQNLERDNLKQVFGQSNGCPMNGFLICLGKSQKKSMYHSTAYEAINTNYLLTMTGLSEEMIAAMKVKYATITSTMRPETLRLNVPNNAMNQLLRLSCGNDYIYSDSKGTSQNATSKTWATGLTAMVFAAIAMIFYYSSFYRLFICAIAFILYVAQFGLTFDVSLRSARNINHGMQGVEGDGSRGYIGYFVALMLLYLIVLGSFFLRTGTRGKGIDP